jgi:triphosphatase
VTDKGITLVGAEPIPLTELVESLSDGCEQVGTATLHTSCERYYDSQRWSLYRRGEVCTCPPAKSARRPLLERFAVHRESERCLLQTANSRIALSASAVEIGELRFGEVELRLDAGAPEELVELSHALCKRLALVAARMSSYERGLQAIAVFPPVKPRMPTLAPDAPASELAFACLRRQFDLMRLHEGAAWEGLHIEGVHQMRVATRRIRAALKIFASVLPQSGLADIRETFRWLAEALGEVRDLDVYLANFASHEASVSPQDRAAMQVFRQEVEAQWRQARQRLLACLATRRYEDLLARFERYLASGPDPHGARISTVDLAREVLDQQWRRVCRKEQRIQENAPPAAYHELRIRCKRLRYACEFFAAVTGPRERRLLRQLKWIQDILGAHQDAWVAVERVRGLCERWSTRRRSPEVFLAMGQVIAGEERTAAELRSKFRKAWATIDMKEA